MSGVYERSAPPGGAGARSRNAAQAPPPPPPPPPPPLPDMKQHEQKYQQHSQQYTQQPQHHQRLHTNTHNDSFRSVNTHGTVDSLASANSAASAASASSGISTLTRASIQPHVRKPPSRVRQQQQKRRFSEDMMRSASLEMTGELISLLPDLSQHAAAAGYSALGSISRRQSSSSIGVGDSRESYGYAKGVPPVDSSLSSSSSFRLNERGLLSSTTKRYSSSFQDLYQAKRGISFDSNSSERRRLGRTRSRQSLSIVTAKHTEKKASASSSVVDNGANSIVAATVKVKSPSASIASAAAEDQISRSSPPLLPVDEVSAVDLAQRSGGKKSSGDNAMVFPNSTDKHSILMAALRSHSSSTSNSNMSATIRSRRYAAQREAAATVVAAPAASIHSTAGVAPTRSIASDAAVVDRFIEPTGLSTSTLGALSSLATFRRSGDSSSSSSSQSDLSVHEVTDVRDILMDSSDSEAARDRRRQRREAAKNRERQLASEAAAAANSCGTPPLHRQTSSERLIAAASTAASPLPAGRSATKHSAAAYVEPLLLHLSGGSEPHRARDTASSSDFTLAKQLESALRRNQLLQKKLMYAQSTCEELRRVNIEQEHSILQLQNDHQRKLSHVAQAAGAVQRELKSKISALEQEVSFLATDHTDTTSSGAKPTAILEHEVRLLRSQMDAIHVLHKQDAAERTHSWEQHQSRLEQQIFDLRMQVVSLEFGASQQQQEQQLSFSPLASGSDAFPSELDDIIRSTTVGEYSALSPDANVAGDIDKDAAIASLSLQVAMLVQRLGNGEEHAETIQQRVQPQQIEKQELKISLPSSPRKHRKQEQQPLFKDPSLSYSHSPTFRNAPQAGDAFFDTISVTAVSLSDDDSFSSHSEKSNEQGKAGGRGKLTLPLDEDAEEVSMLGSPFSNLKQQQQHRRFGVSGTAAATSTAAGEATAAVIAEDVVTRQSTLLKLPSFVLQRDADSGANSNSQASPDKNTSSKRKSSSRNVLMMSPKLHRATSLRRMSFRSMESVRKRSQDQAAADFPTTTAASASSDFVNLRTTDSLADSSCDELSKPPSVDEEEIADRIAQLMASLKEDFSGGLSTPASVATGTSAFTFSAQDTEVVDSAMSTAWQRASQRFQERRRKSFIANNASFNSTSYAETEDGSADSAVGDSKLRSLPVDEERRARRRQLRIAENQRRRSRGGSGLPELLDPATVPAAASADSKVAADGITATSSTTVSSAAATSADPSSSLEVKSTHSAVRSEEAALRTNDIIDSMASLHLTVTRFGKPKFTHSSKPATEREGESDKLEKSSATEAVTTTDETKFQADRGSDESKTSDSIGELGRSDAATTATALITAAASPESMQYQRVAFSFDEQLESPWSQHRSLQQPQQQSTPREFRYFVLELNHRDYVRRLFEALGHGLRTRMLQIYRQLQQQQQQKQQHQHALAHSSSFASGESVAGAGQSANRRPSAFSRAVSLDSGSSPQSSNRGIASALFGSLDEAGAQQQQQQHQQHYQAAGLLSQRSASIDDQVSVGSSHHTSNTLAYSVSTTGATAERSHRGHSTSTAAASEMNDEFTVNGEHFECTALLALISGEHIVDPARRQEQQRDTAAILQCSAKDVAAAAVSARALLVEFEHQLVHSSCRGRYRDSGQIGDFTSLLADARSLIIFFGRRSGGSGSYGDSSTVGGNNGIIGSSFDVGENLSSEAKAALKDLRDLEQQIHSHSASKEQRMAQCGWKWDAQQKLLPIAAPATTATTETAAMTITTSSTVRFDEAELAGEERNVPQTSVASQLTVDSAGRSISPSQSFAGYQSCATAPSALSNLFGGVSQSIDRSSGASLSDTSKHVKLIPFSSAAASSIVNRSAMGATGAAVGSIPPPPPPRETTKFSSPDMSQQLPVSPPANSLRDQHSVEGTKVVAAAERSTTPGTPGSMCGSLQSLNSPADERTRLRRLLELSDGVRAHLLVSLVPSNAAVIELMNCLSSLQELLIGYRDYHKSLGNRAETQVLRSLISAIEQQLNLDLTSTGAYQTRCHQKAAPHAAANAAAANSAHPHQLLLAPAGTIIEETVTGTTALVARVAPTFGSAQRVPQSRVNSAAAAVESPLQSFQTARTALDRILQELDHLAAAPSPEAHSVIDGNNKDSSSTRSRQKATAAGQSALSAKAMRRKSWSSKTAPIDESINERAVVIRHSTKNGYYLLARTRELIKQSEQMVQQLEDSLIALVNLREQQFEDDTELLLDANHEQQLREEEEEVASVIQELVALKQDIEQKILPLRLSYHEELNRLLAATDLAEFLSNDIFSIVLGSSSAAVTATSSTAKISGSAAAATTASTTALSEANNSAVSTAAADSQHRLISVATLLICSRSAALIHSIYSTWPNLIVAYAVVSDEKLMLPGGVTSTTAASTSVAADAAMNSTSAGTAPSGVQQRRRSSVQHRKSISIIDLGAASSFASDVADPSDAAITTTAAATADVSLAPSVKRRSLLRSTTGSNAALMDQSALSASVTTAVGSVSDLQGVDNSAGIDYVEKSAAEVDVSVVDFDSTKTLRMVGFTLPQLRDSRCYDLKALLAANYPLQEVKHLKGSIHGSITVKDLRLAGYSVYQCLNVGFDLVSLRAGGFNDFELVKSDLFSPAQLQRIGCDIQRHALLSLFEATSGYQWRRRDHWGSVKPLSHWRGVQLDGRGQVCKLDLRSNYLKGHLPRALSLLTSLESLDLSNNPLLQGDIPAEYSELTALRSIWLDQTGVHMLRANMRAILPPTCTIRK